jgi:phosphoribosylformylglycinamidine synthase
MKIGVVVFPGSNCDLDCYHVAKNIIGADTKLLWHSERDLNGFDCIILPGGFSYGDYLRAGAIARFSPVMRSIKKFASSGGMVLGICNGFQILLESGLLPGAMIWNKGLKFVCKSVNIRVENNNTIFTKLYNKHEVLNMPIAHFQGNYFAPEEVVKKLIEKNLIIFRYCDARGNVTDESNPNGSIENIAGIMNEEGNILGMMPHPERAAEKILGSIDGRRIFESIVAK